MSSTSSSRVRTGRTLISLLTALIAVLAYAGTAHAEVVRTQRAASDDSAKHLTISPGRLEQDVVPGQRTTFKVTLYNDNDTPVDISVSGVDLGQSSDPRGVASKVEDGEFGAGDWLTSEVSDIRLNGFEQVEFLVVIDPPADAAVGTNLGGVSIQSAPAEGPIGIEGPTALLLPEGIIQVFLTVPGPVEHKLQITDVRERDKFIFGSQRFAVWDVTFRNDGTVNEHATGNVQIRSLFGNSAHTERITDLIVLRGATRTTRVVWNDIPPFGAFTAVAKVRGDDAKSVERSSARLVIFPWWLAVLLLAVVVFPFVFLWWRRRQDWRHYLDDEEWDPEADEDPSLVR